MDLRKSRKKYGLYSLCYFQTKVTTSFREHFNSSQQILDANIFFIIAQKNEQKKAINVLFHLQKSRFHLTALIRTHTLESRERETGKITSITIVISVEFVGLISADMLSQFQLSPEKRSRCHCYFHCHAVVNGKSSSPHGYYYIKQVVQLNIYMLQFCWQIHHLCRKHNFLFHVIWLGFFVVRALASLVVDYFVFFSPTSYLHFDLLYYSQRCE